MESLLELNALRNVPTIWETNSIDLYQSQVGLDFPEFILFDKVQENTVLDLILMVEHSDFGLSFKKEIDFIKSYIGGKKVNPTLRLCNLFYEEIIAGEYVALNLVIPYNIKLLEKFIREYQYVTNA